MVEKRVPTLAKIQSMLLIYDGGQSTSPKRIEKQVDFSTSFSTIPKIVLTAHSGDTVYMTEVTTTYFKWNNNAASADVTVDWLAIQV